MLQAVSQSLLGSLASTSLGDPVVKRLIGRRLATVRKDTHWYRVFTDQTHAAAAVPERDQNLPEPTSAQIVQHSLERAA